MVRELLGGPPLESRASTGASDSASGEGAPRAPARRPRAVPPRAYAAEVPPACRFAARLTPVYGPPPLAAHGGLSAERRCRKVLAPERAEARPAEEGVRTMAQLFVESRGRAASPTLSALRLRSRDAPKDSVGGLGVGPPLCSLVSRSNSSDGSADT